GYFQQLISEKSSRKEVSGQLYRIWELPAGRANEALDCRVYAYAALKGLEHFGLKLNQRCERMENQDFEPMPPLQHAEDTAMVIESGNDHLQQSQGVSVTTKAEKPKRQSLAERMAAMNK
ncbi:phage terminase large subunit family protein, partial [Escherichia coli]|uniref:terminase gpA endonuclease subunit n=1 Tax=Escherichia coli TaxID=562 RepID=UPI001101CA7D